MLVLADVTVYPPLKFKNKKEEEFYWKTVRDVKKTLPYAKLICETLIETYEYIETFPTQKEREEHLKKMEGAVFEQYKPALKKIYEVTGTDACKANQPRDQPVELQYPESFSRLIPCRVLADIRTYIRCQSQDILQA